MAKSGSILGNAVQRLEDPTLLTGAGKYVDDLAKTGMAHVVFVRSHVAHGTITSIDCQRREAMPGVVAVYWAADGRRPRAAAVPGLPDDAGRASTGRSSPSDTVRFVGDIVAAVVAETQRAGGRRRRGGHRRLRPRCRWSRRRPPRWPPTRRCSSPSTAPTSASPPTFGDDVDALEGADAVAEVTMVSQRLAGVPMESNAIVAVPGEPDGGLTLLGLAPGAAQRPRARWRRCSASSPSSCASSARGSAAASGRRPRCTSSTSSPRRPRCALGRPVKWIETRSEDMVSLVHGRDYVMTAKLGVTQRRQDRRPRRQGRRLRPVPTRRSGRSCRCSPR